MQRRPRRSAPGSFNHSTTPRTRSFEAMISAFRSVVSWERSRCRASRSFKASATWPVGGSAVASARGVASPALDSISAHGCALACNGGWCRGPRIVLLPVRIARAESRVGGHRILLNGGHERAPADGRSTAVSDGRAASLEHAPYRHLCHAPDGAGEHFAAVVMRSLRQLTR